MDFERPKGWRKGQTIFNFLEWVRIEKEKREVDVYFVNSQSPRMADPFSWSDGNFDSLWDEYLSSLEEDDGLSIFAN